MHEEEMPLQVGGFAGGRVTIPRAIVLTVRIHGLPHIWGALLLRRYMKRSC